MTTTGTTKGNGKIGLEELHPDVVNMITQAFRPVTLEQTTHKVTLTSNTEQINIGETCNRTEQLILVFKNSVLLTETLDYNISDDGTKILSLKHDWTATTSSPIYFTICVVKIRR